MSWQLLIWLDSGVCAQNPAHTFWLGGQPLPLCARTLGLFGGFLLAGLIPWPSRASSWWLAGIAPLALDGLNSLALGLYPDGNWLRLATGLLAGVSLAAVLGVTHPRLAYLVPALAALALVNAYAALAVLGTIGVLAMLAAANRLLRLMPLRWTVLLALPELATLALVKQAALVALR